MENITGITIKEHQNSKRIIDIRIEDEILDKLISIILFELLCSEIVRPVIFSIISVR